MGADASAIKLTGLKRPVVTLDFDLLGAVLIASADDGTIRGWNLPEGDVAFAAGHEQRLYQVQIAENAKRLLSTGIDGERVWRTDTGNLIFSSNARVTNRLHSSIRADGEQVSWSDSRQTVVSDVSSSRPLFKLDIKTSQANFLHKSETLVTADNLGRVFFWDEKFRPLAVNRHGPVTGEGPSWWSPAVDFAQLGSGLLVSGGQDGRLLLWSGNRLMSAGQVGDLGSSITTVAVAQDPMLVAASSVNGDIGLWDLGQHQQINRWYLPNRFISKLLLSSDGRYMFAGDRGNVGHLWRVADGKLLAEYTMDSRFAVDFSPNSKYIGIGVNHKVQILDVNSLTSKSVESLSSQSPPIGCLKFSSDSSSVVSMSGDKSGFVAQISFEKDDVKRLEVKNSKSCYDAKFSSDNKRVMFRQSGSSVVLWDILNNKAQFTEERIGSIYVADWSPDGNFIITGGTDGLVQVVDSRTGLILQNLAVHGGPISETEFSPDGAVVYSAAEDGRLESWDSSLESRSVDYIANQVACVSPWQLDNNVLQPKTITKLTCFHQDDVKAP